MMVSSLTNILHGTMVASWLISKVFILPLLKILLLTWMQHLYSWK